MNDGGTVSRFFERIFFAEPNPVLLYELRQAVRNRFVLSLMLLYLIATAFLFAVILLLKETDMQGVVFDHISVLSNANGFSTQLTLLVLLSYYVFTTLALTGFGTVRMFVDRCNENPMFYTTLPSWRIVSGKLQFGFVVALLFLSITFPFLAFAYTLRGIDVRQIFVGALLYACMVMLHYFVAVAFFAGVKNRKRLIAVLVPVLLSEYLLSLFGYYALSHFVADNSYMPDYSLILTMLLIVFAMMMTGVFLLTTVQIAPENSNRMMPIRLTATGMQLLFLFFTLFGAFRGNYGNLGSNNQFYLMFSMVFSVGMPWLFLFFICERETLSPRIRQAIPRLFWKRILWFPFYTGSPSAMLWSVLTLLLELPVILIVYLNVLWHSGDMDIIPNIFASLSFGMLFFDYCATTLLIYNVFSKRLHDRLSRQWLWTLPFAFVGGATIFILCASYLSSLVSKTIRPDEIFESLPVLPLPSGHHDETVILIQSAIASVWLAVLIGIGIPWIRRHFMEFKQLEEE